MGKVVLLLYGQHPVLTHRLSVTFEYQTKWLALSNIYIYKANTNSILQNIEMSNWQNHQLLVWHDNFNKIYIII